MQHALLALAIALILAIAAALAAPAYVNWDDWRATFERQASALAGVPVRIRGRIEATILPTPAFTFRAVEVGDPDAGIGVRAGEVRGILSLGALLRGAVEAEEFVLVRPTMRVVVEPGGMLLPAAGAAAAATDLVSFARVAIEGGSLVVEQRGSGTLTTFDEIFANAEMQARQGPFRVDARFRRDGRQWLLRASTGVFGESRPGRVRLTLEQPAEGAVFDAEGNLVFAGAGPRFEGKVTAEQRAGQRAPWRLVGNAKATEESVALDALQLTLGADATPIDLAGEIRLEPRRGGAIAGTLAMRRIDLDAAAGAETQKALSTAAVTARGPLALLRALPLRGRIELAAEAVIAGGGTVRDLKAELGLREGALAIERAEARLPGRGTISAQGGANEDSLFAGGVTMEAEDAAALARWAFGGAVDASFAEPRPFRAQAKVSWSDGRLSVEQLDLVHGDAKIGGGFAIGPGSDARRTSVETKLTASGADLDLFAPFYDLVRSSAASVDLAFGLKGSALRMFGRSMRAVDIDLSRTAEGVAIKRLRLEDFDGLSIQAQGRVAAPIDRPSGRIEFGLAVTRPEGLGEVAERLAGADARTLVHRIVNAERPLRLAGTISGAGQAAGVELAAKGSLGDAESNVAASFDLLAGSLSEARLTLSARDAGDLVSLFGLTPGPPSPGEGTLEIDLSKPAGETLPVSARLTAPGASIAAEGELRRGADGRIAPRLELRLDASDLRPLLAVAARAGGEKEVVAEGTARLTRDADTFAFENVALTVAGARVRGSLTASAIENAAIGGRLSVERMEFAHLLSLVFGNAPQESAFWPARRLGPAALAGATGSVALEVGALGLVGRLTATEAKFRLRLGPKDAALEEFSADLAGGQLTGHARFVRGETLGLDGNAKLAGFDVARLLAPGTWRSAARGRGDLSLALAGSGPTPSALAVSLAGQGTLALQGLEIDRLDPGAIAAVFAAAEKGEPPDEVAVVAVLAPAFARGPLRVERVETPLVVASGVARIGKVAASAGAAQISAAANLDLARLTVDGAIELEIPAPPGLTARPGATVRWRGPIAAPERGIEAASLATAITLRAMERETKRIEERDRALPPLLPKRTEPAPPPGQSGSLDASVAPAAVTPAGPGGPTASVPPAAAPARVPVPPSRPRAANPSTTIALPPLAPPIEVRPAPSIFPPQQ